MNGIGALLSRDPRELVQFFHHVKIQREGIAAYKEDREPAHVLVLDFSAPEL